MSAWLRGFEFFLSGIPNLGGDDAFPVEVSVQTIRQLGSKWRAMMDKVWLVTGSANGLGRNIAEAVLESGDRLVATAP